jgi:signal transduction histidine kinase
MPSKKKARLIFAAALVLLFLSGIAASFTIARLLNTARWIGHTYDVKLVFDDIESALLQAARYRTAYLNSGDAALLPQYEAARTATQDTMRRVRAMTADNPDQQNYCNQLESLLAQRFALLDASIAMRKQGPLDDSTLTRMSRENVALGADLSGLLQKMDQEEDRLLEQRRELSGSLFTIALFILCAMFVLAIVLLWVYFRLLSKELVERERMEENARHLSGRLLTLQDEERRKFSRELHDSLGQLLAMAKMHMFVLLEKNPNDELLTEVEKLLEQSITETRTISHLLHPPLLDEMGLGTAAKWYAEGFAQRSGLELKVEVTEDLQRLPRPAELALFRVLQESLTNIHRHSKSTRADIALVAIPKAVLLRIRDYGVGIPETTLRRFLSVGTNVGVGLSGIRERIREQGGKFDIQSSKSGTTISVTMPVTPIQPEPEPSRLAAAATAD